MVTGINKIAGVLAALTITGVVMPVVAHADDWHDRRDRDRVVVVRDDHWGPRHDVRVIEAPVYHPTVVVGAAPVFVTPGCGPGPVVIRHESLQDQKNDARNVAAVGLAATALGIVTHNRALTTVGAIGAIAGGATYQQDQHIQNERNNW